jgi:hypothetical protein
MTVEDYIATRLIDDGAPLNPKRPA